MSQKINHAIADNHRQQAIAAKVSIAVSLILFLLAATVGILVDSITLLLDASAGLIILIVAVLMHFALKKIHSPPDDSFNFGYEKYESLTLLLQNVLITATCLVSVKFAIQDVVHAEDVHSYSLPALATFISGIIGCCVALYLRNIGARTESGMLKSASYHWFADTLLAFGVCAGFTLGFILQQRGQTAGNKYIDPVMAVTLAVILVAAPLKNITRNMFELLDAVPDHYIRNRLKEVAESYKPRSFGIHRLRSRKAGEKVFVDVCFLAKPEMTVAEVEELSAGFEKDLQKYLPRCDVVVSFKPKV